MLMSATCMHVIKVRRKTKYVLYKMNFLVNLNSLIYWWSWISNKLETHIKFVVRWLTDNAIYKDAKPVTIFNIVMMRVIREIEKYTPRRKFYRIFSKRSKMSIQRMYGYRKHINDMLKLRMSRKSDQTKIWCYSIISVKGL